ncbi:MAG: zinc finger domain-containing protein, partial [Caulobacteraceae bacterium]
LLLDQRIVAGVGNIYACEALHGARLSPTRPAGEVARAELVRLATAVRRVLRAAIVAGGSTLRDFADTEGRDGYFQHTFRVYGRAGEQCPRRGCAGVIARIVQAGRSTFHCPVCQT